VSGRFHNDEDARYLSRESPVAEILSVLSPLPFL